MIGDHAGAEMTADEFEARCLELLTWLTTRSRVSPGSSSLSSVDQTDYRLLNLRAFDKAVMKRVYNQQTREAKKVRGVELS